MYKVRQNLLSLSILTDLFTLQIYQMHMSKPEKLNPMLNLWAFSIKSNLSWHSLIAFTFLFILRVSKSLRSKIVFSPFFFASAMIEINFRFREFLCNKGYGKTCPLSLLLFSRTINKKPNWNWSWQIAIGSPIVKLVPKFWGWFIFNMDFSTIEQFASWISFDEYSYIRGADAR